MIYFDTNYILKCYLPEVGSSEARAVFEANAGNIACSRLGRVEWHATIRRKLHAGNLSMAEVEEIHAQMDEDEAAGLWNWLPFDESLLDVLCGMLRTTPFTGGLKTLDAVHLESARIAGLTEFYSNDHQLKTAAPIFGLVPNDVIP